MGASYAGITVPDGEPGALRSAARSLATISGELSDSAAQLCSMPGLLGGWFGPASVVYAGSCQIAGQGISASATATDAAGAALGQFGDRLDKVQHDARRAIAHARDAQRRIDHATKALADGAAAAADEAAAQRELDKARDDLARAKADGERAEAEGKAIARAVASAFADAGGTLPGGGGSNGGGGLAAFLKTIGGPGIGIPSDALIKYLEEKAGVLSKAARRIVPDYRVGARWVRGHWRGKPNGGRTWVKGYYRGGTIVSGETAATVKSLRLGKWAKWAGRTGNVLSFVLPTLGQIGDDLNNPNLSTTDKVGRAAGVGVYGGALSLGGMAAGSAAGAAIGSAVPIIGTAAGAFIGGIIGSGAGGLIADATKGVAVAAGQWTANAVVDIADGAADLAGDVADNVGDAVDTAGDVLDSINPF